MLGRRMSSYILIELDEVNESIWHNTALPYRFPLLVSLLGKATIQKTNRKIFIFN